ncbi:MAG TPA: SCO family protein [Steroidobacteraceae bacterium]|nr:SCO family protein [Steroidobacteraceae bacterium]
MTTIPKVARASWMGTGISLVAIISFAAAAIWSITFGLRSWTTEEIRRLRVQAEPPVLGGLQLTSSNGASFRPWGGSQGGRRVWLVTFMYTRCPTLCTTLGIEFERLQRALGQDPRDDHVRLLSISFDPAHDDTLALRAYAAEHHSDPARWIVAVPSSASALAKLKREAGIVVIKDGLGGYTHNAAIHVVVDDGRLVRIFAFDNPEAALAWARRL